MKDDLGNRMKCYEQVTRNHLTRRISDISKLEIDDTINTNNEEK